MVRITRENNSRTKMVWCTVAGAVVSSKAAYRAGSKLTPLLCHYWTLPLPLHWGPLPLPSPLCHNNCQHHTVGASSKILSTLIQLYFEIYQHFFHARFKLSNDLIRSELFIKTRTLCVAIKNFLLQFLQYKTTIFNFALLFLCSCG